MVDRHRRGGHTRALHSGGQLQRRKCHSRARRHPLQSSLPPPHLYAKGQAGAFIWSKSITRITFTPPRATVYFDPRAQPAYLYAGGIEYAPFTRLHLRGEVGGLTLQDVGPSATNHLHTSIGVFVPFGAPLAWQPQPLADPGRDLFWNGPTILLVTANVLASAADGITTKRFIRRGFEEGDPIARPLVKSGPAGQVSILLLETGAETLAMYALHRMHHHVVERSIPVAAAAHAVFAYQNLNFRIPPQ